MPQPGNRRDCLHRLAAAAAGAVPGLAWPEAARETLRLLAPMAHDRFGHHVVAVLQRALEELGPRYRLETVPQRLMSQGRLELVVADPAGGIDLMWGMSSAARRQVLRRIDVRLDQGLIGWRVLVVRADDLARWPAHLDAAEIRSRRAGQGLHWPDVAILRDNGYKVETAPNAPTLYEMLLRGHIDHFPRSAMEVTDELATLAPKGVAIVPDLVLRYDAGNHVFMGPHRQQAVADLGAALARLEARGELKKRFAAAFDPVLRDLRLASRRVIELRNTLD